MPSYALIIFTDGREECFTRTLASAMENLPLERFDQRIVIDDSGDPAYRAVVDELAPRSLFTVIHHDGRYGFGGAIRSGWIRVHLDVDFVFHLEDDFLFNEPVDVEAMTGLLEANPHLAQVALLRQPCNSAEEAAGGVMQQHPEAYVQCSDAAGRWWVEHRLFFTTNPSLYRRRLIEHGWPTGEHSEGQFTQELRADPNLRFAYWGKTDDGPRVHHIGADRIGVGY